MNLATKEVLVGRLYIALAGVGVLAGITIRCIYDCLVAIDRDA